MKDSEVSVTVGLVLREHIVPLKGITQDKLASALGVSRHTVNELLNDRRSITASMAVRLGRALGTTPQFWMDLQRDSDLAAAERELGASINSIPVLRAPQSKEDVVVPFDSLFPSE